jgi:hypothetical protein
MRASSSRPNPRSGVNPLYSRWTYDESPTRLWFGKTVRERSKTCDSCSAVTPTLYRCRSNRLKNWKFLCRRCTERLKAERPESYQYGGTWKRFKS